MELDEASVRLVSRLRLPHDPATWSGCLDAVRDGFAELLADPAAPAAEFEDVSVAVEGGNIDVRVVIPVGERPGGLLVYLHGGGWVLGSAASFEGFGRRIADVSGWVVALVGYRRAPEHRFPGPLDDADAALQALYSMRTRWVDEADPVALGGDSAGGNLALVAACRARDRGAPRIDLQLLIYPIVDAASDDGSSNDPRNQLFLTRQGLRWFWDVYLPTEDQRSDPDASPLRASDLSGLPPTVVVAAWYDPLRDQGEALVSCLRAAGVPTKYHMHPDQMHGFMCLPLPGRDAGIRQLSNALRSVQLHQG